MLPLTGECLMWAALGGAGGQRCWVSKAGFIPSALCGPGTSTALSAHTLAALNVCVCVSPTNIAHTNKHRCEPNVYGAADTRTKLDSNTNAPYMSSLKPGTQVGFAFHVAHIVELWQRCAGQATWKLERTLFVSQPVLHGNSAASVCRCCCSPTWMLRGVWPMAPVEWWRGSSTSGST